MTHRCSLHCILPPCVLHRLSTSDSQEVRETAVEALRLDSRFRIARAEAAARGGGRRAQPVTFARVGGKPQRTIYDQHEEEGQAPGTVARSEGQEPVADKSINQA